MTANDQPNMRRRFLIVTQARSGSYHLTSLLDSAGDVTCLGEIFKPDKVELPADMALKTGYGLRDVDKRNADYAAYLDRLMSGCDSPVFGFKEFLDRIARSGLGPATLRSRDWRKIFLTRNAIRIYVSAQRASETGRYTKRAQGPAPHDNRVIRFDPGLFEYTLRADRAFRDRFRGLKSRQPARVTTIDYRDLACPEKMSGLLGFIGSRSEAGKLQSSYYRQNSIPLEQSFEDFGIVRRYMTENGHAALLEDALQPGV
ncbi:LPS sulfotransferase NodH [Paracoccus halophilus]|uniref:LPS sulfotransferase NodH n=1 Tax=Paracoccus halophilus TaxID=376733 RepID=A0A099F437_9RHOB|nr:hypothetical protein [Paracoccus halophilus]KGJ04976.1 hypothetical protein IT41_08085 [Paracoccus halophilus]SFA39490.1 LPS sulfotransferase NodH [Paracoccus halophilus]